MTLISLLKRRPKSYSIPRTYRHHNSPPDDDQVVNPKSLEELEDFFPVVSLEFISSKSYDSMTDSWQQVYKNLVINIVYEYCRHLVHASHRLAVLAIITDLLSPKYNFREGADMCMAMIKASYLCYQEWSCEAKQQLLSMYADWNYFENETNGSSYQVLISNHHWKQIEYGNVIGRVLDLTSDMLEMINKVLPSSISKEGLEFHKYNVNKINDARNDPATVKMTRCTLDFEKVVDGWNPMSADLTAFCWQELELVKIIVRSSELLFLI